MHLNRVAEAVIEKTQLHVVFAVECGARITGGGRSTGRRGCGGGGHGKQKDSVDTQTYRVRGSSKKAAFLLCLSSFTVCVCVSVCVCVCVFKLLSSPKKKKALVIEYETCIFRGKKKTQEK